MSEISYTWIEDDRALADLLTRHAGEARYALDTEFMMGRTYATHLALVQIAWPGETALVDATSVDVSALTTLFDSDSQMLAHSASNDLDVLDEVIHARPRRLFDTQVAAQILGWSQPSLNMLTGDLLGVHLDKSQQRTDWLARPLSEAALHYAASDVVHLFALADALSDRLAERSRVEWNDEEAGLVLAKRRTPLAPDELWWNLQRAETIPPSKQLGAQLTCVVRDQWAQRLDRPPTTLLSDAAVVALAKRPPRRLDDVVNASGSKPPHRGLAKDVLELFSTLATRDDVLRPLARAPFDDALSPLLGLFSALATQRARDLEIDAGLLASKSDLSELIEGRPSRLDTTWRGHCLTDDLKRVRAGGAAIAVTHDRLVVQST
jgi:ribonuclease D